MVGGGGDAYCSEGYHGSIRELFCWLFSDRLDRDEGKTLVLEHEPAYLVGHLGHDSDDRIWARVVSKNFQLPDQLAYWAKLWSHINPQYVVLLVQPPFRWIDLITESKMRSLPFLVSMRCFCFGDQSVRNTGVESDLGHRDAHL